MSNSLQPEKWVDQYADYLFSFALYRVNDKEQAEDLVQETFLSAYKSKHQFAGNANEKTWLTSILKNKIIDYYRKNARQSEILDTVSTSYFFDEENGHWNDANSPKDISLNALDKLQQKELNLIVATCMELLPPTWNRISKLKLIDDEKTEIVCQAFDITPSNLWVIMHRAKLQLRDCIDKKFNHV